VFAIRATQTFDGERFLPGGGATVLVDDGTILGVEPVGFPVPDGCPLTSYDGTLLPGLVDTHAHLTCDGSVGALDKVAGYSPDELQAVIAASLAEQVAAGVTTVRDLGDVDYCTLVRRDAPGPTEPRMAVAGPPITTAGGHCHFLGGVVTGEAGMRAAVAERVERGVDVVKVMASGGMLTPGSDVFGTQFSDDELRCLVETAHNAGLPVLAHAHSLTAVRQAMQAGVDGIEHFSCLTSDGPVYPADLVQEVADRGIAVCLTMGNDQAEIDRLPEPPPGLKVMLERLGLTSAQAMALRRQAVSTLAAAGARLVNGVDAGIAPVKRHGNAWRAVLDVHLSGQSIGQALASATSVSADACGFGGVTGRLAPGYDADLLVVDGDLATEPDALGRPVAVVVRGTLLPP
jgi:imidazolonepropionase-like amidohydrolase